MTYCVFCGIIRYSMFIICVVTFSYSDFGFIFRSLFPSANLSYVFLLSWHLLVLAFILFKLIMDFWFMFSFSWLKSSTYLFRLTEDLERKPAYVIEHQLWHIRFSRIFPCSTRQCISPVLPTLFFLSSEIVYCLLFTICHFTLPKPTQYKFASFLLIRLAPCNKLSSWQAFGQK